MLGHFIFLETTFQHSQCFSLSGGGVGWRGGEEEARRLEKRVRIGGVKCLFGMAAHDMLFRY